MNSAQDQRRLACASLAGKRWRETVRREKENPVGSTEGLSGIRGWWIRTGADCRSWATGVLISWLKAGVAWAVENKLITKKNKSTTSGIQLITTCAPLVNFKIFTDLIKQIYILGNISLFFCCCFSSSLLPSSSCLSRPHQSQPLSIHHQYRWRNHLQCHNKGLPLNLTSLSFPSTIPFYNDALRHTTYCDYMPNFQGFFVFFPPSPDQDESLLGGLTIVATFEPGRDALVPWPPPIPPSWSAGKHSSRQRNLLDRIHERDGELVERAWTWMCGWLDFRWELLAKIPAKPSRLDLMSTWHNKDAFFFYPCFKNVMRF